MKLIESLCLLFFHKLDPEVAHNLSIRTLKMGLIPSSDTISSPRLVTSLAGIPVLNPLGLAAGFDKNAKVIPALSRSGFGFLEVGAVTPLPQPGNPKPRSFRLPKDKAAINRFGFNNDGMQKIAHRLAKRPSHNIPVGLNIGANKESANRTDDYIKVMEYCGPYVDFVTINISSPNTEKLRNLQNEKALAALLQRIMEAREKMKMPKPVFLKIAPDLENDDIAIISYSAVKNGVDAIVATNTTLSREDVKDPQKIQSGGLSGEPLFEKSTRMLAQFSKHTEGNIPLIGVGGISSAKDAYAKIQAGASVLQLYTAMVYQGLSVVTDIVSQLDQMLANDGYDNITQAVGTSRNQWL